jgi:hypothetical protein
MADRFDIGATIKKAHKISMTAPLRVARAPRKRAPRGLPSFMAQSSRLFLKSKEVRVGLTDGL